MNRQQRLEWLQKLPPEKQRMMYFVVNLFCLWLVVSFYLFWSEEAIFILPAFFLGCFLCLLRIYLSKTLVMQGTLMYLIWGLTLALFSYVGSIDDTMRPFFPLLCLLFGLGTLVACWRKRSFFIAMQICIWVLCIAVTFFFGFWPVGLIAIGVAFLLSLTIYMAALHRKPVTKVQVVERQSVAVSQKEVQMPQSTFESQVPGQQYQPLLPEYDSSFGPYIQDLLRE